MPHTHPNFDVPEKEASLKLIELAIREDLAIAGDITSKAVISADYQGKAQLVARSCGIISGLPVVLEVCNAVDVALKVEAVLSDGTPVNSSDTLAYLSGPLRSLLAVERIALNFLQRLSGISTLTHKYVNSVNGTGCQVLDTRKTTPGWRVLEKYAVRCGGGTNHRMGLYDAVMIKDNHLAGLRVHGKPISEAIRLARIAVSKETLVEVEVDSVSQVREALAARPDIILLDNMDLLKLQEAVALRNTLAPAIRLEASGGITLDTIRGVAETGVDCISVGALTHSAPALDIALDYIE